jgi:four helix bundle protein
LFDVHGFRELDAYRRAVALANDVFELSAGWESFARWTLGVQLVRAADSVAANIAEATGRWHGPDRRRLLFIARGSLNETEHWLLVAEERGLLPSRYSARVSEIAKPLNGLIRRNPPTPDTRDPTPQR